jgi:hypothetical protein
VSESSRLTAIRVAHGNLGVLYALHGLFEEAIDALEVRKCDNVSDTRELVSNLCIS